MDGAKCKTCKIFKNLSDFRKKNRGSQTHENTCKICQQASSAKAKFKGGTPRVPSLNRLPKWNLAITALDFFQIYQLDVPVNRVVGISKNTIIDNTIDFLNGFRDTRNYSITFECTAVFENMFAVTFNQTRKNQPSSYISNSIDRTSFDKLLVLLGLFIDGVMENYDGESNVVFIKITSFRIIIYERSIIRGGRLQKLKGGTYVQLPNEIESLDCVINVKNSDTKCFMWSILAHYYGDVEYNKFKNSFKDVVFTKRNNKKFYTASPQVF